MENKKTFLQRLEEKRFSNIGKRIQKIALIYFCILCGLGLLISLFGLIMIIIEPAAFLIMLFYAGLLILSGYVSTCFLYGFGKIVAKHDDEPNEGDEDSVDSADQLPEL